MAAFLANLSEFELAGTRRKLGFAASRAAGTVSQLVEIVADKFVVDCCWHQ